MNSNPRAVGSSIIENEANRIVLHDLNRLGPRHETALVVLVFLIFCFFPTNIVAQTMYRAGDQIEDFTLTNRDTGEPLRLSDFDGKIVFLEWFAWW